MAFFKSVLLCCCPKSQNLSKNHFQRDDSDVHVFKRQPKYYDSCWAGTGLILCTVFENRPKSRIQHSCSQTVLPDSSILIGQKLAKNAKIEKIKCDFTGDF